jgi:hypothetical protein
LFASIAQGSTGSPPSCPAPSSRCSGSAPPGSVVRNRSVVTQVSERLQLAARLAGSPSLLACLRPSAAARLDTCRLFTARGPSCCLCSSAAA